MSRKLLTLFEIRGGGDVVCNAWGGEYVLHFRGGGMDHVLNREMDHMLKCEVCLTQVYIVYLYV